MGQLIAVTGATGFIGSNLVEGLVERGYSVRALTRRQAPVNERVAWVRGELHDPDALSSLVEGAAAIIHCAGAVRGASAAAFHHTNVAGTERLVETALQQQPWPRFLFLSSLAARQPQLSWYAHSKRQAELSIARNADTMPWTTYRPTAVYGPGDRELKPLFDGLRRGWLPVLGERDSIITLLYVRDLVRAILAGLERPDLPRGIFELHDGTVGGYDWATIATIAARILARPVRRVPLPAAGLHASAALNLAAARLIGYSPMLTPGKVRELRYGDWRCDNTELTRATGWSPRIRLGDALADAGDTIS